MTEEKPSTLWLVMRHQIVATRRGGSHPSILRFAFCVSHFAFFLIFLQPHGVIAQSERERFETFRRRASALAQLTVLDECLLFTADQRAKLLAALDLPENDPWWRPNGTDAMLDTASTVLFERLSGRGLGCFMISDAELTRLLLPSQLAIVRELRRPVVAQFIVERRAAANADRDRGALFDVHPSRPIPRGADDVEWLSLCLALRVHMLFVTSGLRVSQRQKLLLAGALDLEGLRERPLARRPASKQQNEVIERSRVTGVPLAMPPAVLDEQTSAFQKMLRRLTDEQLRQLRASQDERRDFRRRAIVAAAVVGFARRAPLTAAECEELSRAFHDVVAVAPAVELERECLLATSRLSDERLRPFFADEQWPAARDQLQQLAQMAESLKPSTVARKLVLRKVRVTTLWKNKEPWSDLQMDELELDFGAR